MAHWIRLVGFRGSGRDKANGTVCTASPTNTYVRYDNKSIRVKQGSDLETKLRNSNVINDIDVDIENKDNGCIYVWRTVNPAKGYKAIHEENIAPLVAEMYDKVKDFGIF
jgi:hypothetical protein